MTERGPAWVRRVRAQWRGILVLALVWVALWGRPTSATVLSGLAIAVAVVALLPLPSVRNRLVLRGRGFVVLVGRFGRDLVVASAQVARIALSRRRPHGALIGVRLRVAADVYLTIVAELASLVPGSIVVEAHRLTGTLYLHVLDLDLAGGADRVRADTLALEARVLQAFAPDDILRGAGLAPADPTARRRPRRGRGPADSRAPRGAES